jgi:hypothetical protein
LHQSAGGTDYLPGHAAVYRATWSMTSDCALVNRRKKANQEHHHGCNDIQLDTHFDAVLYQSLWLSGPFPHCRCEVFHYFSPDE